MTYKPKILEVAAGGTGKNTLASHAILVGEGTGNIAAVGPGSAGQVLLSGGASADPTYSTATYPSTATSTGKVLIADGTNWVASTPTFPDASATSGKFIRSDGTNWIASTPTLPTTGGTESTLLRSDGTNWVNTANFKVSSGDIMTNTSQPSFYVYLNTPISNVTGDGTLYSILFDATEFDQGSDVTLNSSGKTIFTVPVEGVYLLTCSVSLTGIAAGETLFNLDILCSAGGVSARLNGPSPLAVQDVNNQCGFYTSVIRKLPLNTICEVRIQVSGGAKGVGLNGLNNGLAVTTFSGCLLC